MLLHITSQSAWDIAQQKGEYKAKSLEIEGFIHCSTSDQVLRVANQFYQGHNDLVVLVIDPQKLQSPVKWENAVHPSALTEKSAQIEDSEQFPHVYGAINLDAVVKILPLQLDSQGVYYLPL